MPPTLAVCWRTKHAMDSKYERRPVGSASVETAVNMYFSECVVLLGFSPSGDM